MTEPELTLADFVSTAAFADLPEDALTVVKRVVLTTLSTAVAGAGEEGLAALRKVLTARGGTPEATTFVFHDRLPAPSAALLNGTMCRALDFCDAMAPGLHIGRGTRLRPASVGRPQRSRCRRRLEGHLMSSIRGVCRASGGSEDSSPAINAAAGEDVPAAPRSRTRHRRA